MELVITKDQAHVLGKERAGKLSIELPSYRDTWHVNLRVMSRPALEQLRGWMDELVAAGVKGAKAQVRDIKSWMAALDDPVAVKAHGVKDWSALATEYLRQQPRHWLYRRIDGADDVWLAYYVNRVEYHPPRGEARAYCSVQLLWEGVDGRDSTSISVGGRDARGKTAREVLARLGYYPQSEERAAVYEAETQRWNATVKQVGLQMLASGSARPRGSSSRWSYYTTTYAMVRDGDPTKVVVDVVKEGDEERTSYGGGGDKFDPLFWGESKPRGYNRSGTADDEDFGDQGDNAYEREGTLELAAGEQIPVHPYCIVFDLRRHLRMLMHINYLAPYVYDVHMGDRLVLDQASKDMISTLVQRTRAQGFQDIVSGKGGGVSVLLTGPPGVGKTLTAEVFAEASQRPLYTVQAAQLGIEAETLEKNLTQVLARGSRWNAVVLIDEADVYIRSRGEDLNHNAIVGAFLRVMEYHDTVLFFTTNLPERVEDAVASRCIARIDYKPPTQAEQKQIWQVLAEVNGCKIKPAALNEIVKRHGWLTGRDIKQFLKLGQVVAASNGNEITPEVIDYVARFRPTVPVHAMLPGTKRTCKLHGAPAEVGGKQFQCGCAIA